MNINILFLFVPGVWDEIKCLFIIKQFYLQNRVSETFVLLQKIFWENYIYVFL